MMRIEDDQLFPIRGGVAIMSYFQGLPVNQLGTPIHFPWEYLAEKES